MATAAHFLLATKTPLKTALPEKAGLSVPKFTTKWVPAHCSEVSGSAKKVLEAPQHSAEPKCWPCYTQISGWLCLL